MQDHQRYKVNINGPKSNKIVVGDFKHPTNGNGQVIQTKTEQSIKQGQNTYSSPVHTEHSVGQIM